MTSGYFITFEGGEGGGKSTQISRLADRLSRLGRDVVATREPGGSPGAEALRALLVRGDRDSWSPLAETLLLYAARADHLEQTIRPALTRGAIVLSDRFADSTRAYQGAAGGVSPDFIGRLEAEVLGPTRPNLTLIFDLPVEEGLRRASRRGGEETRFESKGSPFHERLRQGFLHIAAAEPERCLVIDAAESADVVEAQVWASVAARLGLAGSS